MISTGVEFLKSLIVLIFILGITDLIVKLFLRRTFVGRIVYIMLKDLWLVSKHSFRITRKTCKAIYKYSKMLYQYLDGLYKKYNESKQEQETTKQVVNNESSNVIDLKKFIAEKQQQKSR
jgi:hypothetical protein